MAANPSTAVAVGGAEEPSGMEALRRLGLTSPPLYLSPSPDLVCLARDASKQLFSSLLPFCPKSLPLDRLLVDEGFDAEQIWHQIELQSRPLVFGLKRDVRRFGKMDLGSLFGGLVAREGGKGEGNKASEVRGGGANGIDVVANMEEDEDEEEDEREEEEEEEEKEAEEEEEKGEKKLGVEDRFLKIKELEEYMKKDEAREYGEKERGEREEDEDEDEDEGGKKEKFVDFYGEDDDDEDGGSVVHATYEDFFGGKRKKSAQTEVTKKKQQSSKKSSVDGLEDLNTHDEEEESTHPTDTDSEQNDDDHISDQNDETLSKYEIQRKKLQANIEQLEKENLGPKPWTMMGEVTATKRPKNSALEVDLDFEHNRGLPPVTTVEIAHVEDIILKRIREGNTDEVQKAPTLPSKAPKEHNDLDENKSKKGLAEIYEEEYAQKTGLVSAPLTFSDEQKKEASLLFKRICLKLDALSHFHFTPKPVIEDMSIQANVPALAMEEIAPLAVSDASMLAPEEIFSGKGDIKEEAELTQDERKRRRANKKRKFKSDNTKRAANRAQQNIHSSNSNGKEDS